VYDPHFFEAHGGASARSAEIVVPVVVEALHPRSVVDVGCGTGAWLAEFRRSGVQDILGVDNHTPSGHLKIPEVDFRRYDLRNALSLERRFDLAISLEVAEHLPPDCSEAFVRSLTRLAPLVLFSAAVPFQGGWGHTNERWQDSWRALFRASDFHAVDLIRHRLWSHAGVEAYYLQNCLLYAHSDALERLASDGLNPVGPDTSLDVIHPRLWSARTDPSVQSLGWTVRQVLPVGRHWLRRKLKSRQTRT
jgi:SAM-dependent methyltransferase